MEGRDGKERRFLFAHVAEPRYFCMVEGRGGEEWYSSRTRTKANIFVWWKGGVENDGLGRCICMLLDQRHIARTRTGANSNAWWKGGVEKNGVLFAHVPEPVN